MNKTLLWMLGAAMLTGCAQMPSASKPPLVSSETTIRPQAQEVAPVSKGSLMPVSQVSLVGYRGLFEERRVSKVGDTLTVLLNETTRASKDGGTNASRQSNHDLSANANLRSASTGTTSKNDSNTLSAGAGSNGTTRFNSNGGASASNEFSGTITVTVIEVLSNGNLVVAGEKRLAVGAEEELIRLGGVVSPLSIKGNSVLSSQVADARIEYRGAGITDEIQRPGWLTQLLTRYSPN